MSDYILPKHRFYELKHFCLQYPDWKKAYEQLNDGCSKCLDDDPTARIGILRADYARCMELIESVAKSNDILLAATTGYRPDGDLTDFYAEYGRFFWMLDKEKGL